MKEQLISFETAKLAKEQGFDEYSNEYSYHEYLENDEFIDPRGAGDVTVFKRKGDVSLFKGGATVKTISYKAPTQSLLQKWLREKHGIHIDVFIEDEKPYKNFYYRVMNIGEYFVNSYYDDKSITYEKALEKGLQKALKLIKQ